MSRPIALDLFSGIGGFALGLEAAGFEVGAFAEVDRWCRGVLRRHWPTTPIYRDVRHVTKRSVRFEPDLVCGGFPCQPISAAGAQRGEADERWLWPEFARVLRDLRPRVALVENVSNLLAGDDGRWFGGILGELAALGYDAQWHCVPASHIGAPHQRDRLWIVAHADGRRVRVEPERDQRQGRDARATERGDAVAVDAGAGQLRADADGRRCEEQRLAEHARFERELGHELDRLRSERWRNGADVGEPGRTRSPVGSGPAGQRTHAPAPGAGGWTTEPAVGRVAYGIPRRVDRLRGLGNAVVPQLVEAIGRALVASAWIDNRGDRHDGTTGRRMVL